MTKQRTTALAEDLALYRKLWRDFAVRNGREPTLAENAALARQAGFEGDDADMPICLSTDAVKDLAFGVNRGPAN